MILKYAAFHKSKCPRAHFSNFIQPLYQVGHLSKTSHPILAPSHITSTTHQIASLLQFLEVIIDLWNRCEQMVWIMTIHINPLPHFYMHGIGHAHLRFYCRRRHVSLFYIQVQGKEIQFGGFYIKEILEKDKCNKKKQISFQNLHVILKNFQMFLGMGGSFSPQL